MMYQFKIFVFYFVVVVESQCNGGVSLVFYYSFNLGINIEDVLEYIG